MEKFRLLTPADIECKVKQINEKGAVLLLYKTARTDMDILDETVGADNWDCDYKEIKGNLYCIIGIRFETAHGERWVYKSDCGIESREDDEGNQKKGEASDAFKRAGFKWGIGRELYTAPFIWIPANKIQYAQNSSRKTNNRFSVTRIEYDEQRRIKTLSIRNDSTGFDVFFWTSDTKVKIEPPVTEAPKAPITEEPKATEVRCERCGRVILPYKNSRGETVSVEQHVEVSRKKCHDMVLCPSCAVEYLQMKKNAAAV